MRSYLFVPGDSARKMGKGLGSGADALIIDLEDSVAPSAKENARQVTVDFFARSEEHREPPAAVSCGSTISHRAIPQPISMR